GFSLVSTHSRPKAAGRMLNNQQTNHAVSTHSRPKAAGKHGYCDRYQVQFQHTAARRRLVSNACGTTKIIKVSTHSRPKAAGKSVYGLYKSAEVSTHSRPKAAGRTMFGRG
ncbi:hypothetical protein NEIMUCOT_06407, partial [Neisseria mucosa ATCC 25996]